MNTDLQVVKFAWVVFVPNRSNYTGRIACLDCERESLCLKNDPALFSWLNTHNFLHRFFKIVDVEGLTPPWISKAKGWKMCPLSVKQTYLAVFNFSASSAAVPGLATDPFSILLGARRSTQVTSQTNCLPSSQGARVIPSDRFGPFGSRIEGTLMELRACFTSVLRLWCLEKRPALLAQERPWRPFSSTSLSQRQVCFSQIFPLRRRDNEMRSCWSVNFRARLLLGTTFNQAETKGS